VESVGRRGERAAVSAARVGVGVGKAGLFVIFSTMLLA
jgi:hypothetical protein